MIANTEKQDEAIVSIKEIAVKLPALEGGRLPVVLPAGGGGLTDSELRAAPVPVSGALTDSELRASAVPVSVASVPSHAVTGPLTNAELRASAVPVSLASLPKAREDSAAMTWASLKSAAPVANAVQADTGALTAGDYDFDIFLAVSDTAAVGKGLVVEHRNAANNATTQTLGGCAAPGNQILQIRRYTIGASERIRVIAGTAAGAASSMYVSAIGRRIS